MFAILDGLKTRVSNYDRRSAVAVGAFANVVQRCRDGPMLPYLLFYDSLTAAPEALG